MLRALVACVRSFREAGRSPDLIIVTGDVAFSGKRAEYERATVFFDDILAAAGLQRRQLLAIPGNHDVDRDLGVGLARTLSSGEEADRYFAPDAPMPHLAQKQRAFWDWYDAFFASIRSRPASSCGPVELVVAGDRRVGVLPINSALFCQDDGDHAKLWVGRRALDTALGQLDALDAEIRVALVHHPLDWLADLERANVRATLAGSVDVVLRGHLHETDVKQIVSQHGGTVEIAAGAAYQTRRWPNCALYATLQGASIELFPIRYEDTPTEVWTVDPSVFPRASDYTGRVDLHSRDPSTGGVPAALVSDPVPRPVVAFRGNVPSRRGVPVVGREDELGAISDTFSELGQERVLVVCGAPGVGKSELAREYARRYRERYPGGTFLIDASTNVPVDLARIATNILGISPMADSSIDDQCQQALIAIAGLPSLLIYDNVQSLVAIERWLPAAGMPCHVLITTVHEPRDGGWPLHEVKPLTTGQALELVEALGGPAVAATHGPDLIAHAGGLPVQLCPAAAVIAYDVRRGRSGQDRLAWLANQTRDSFQLVYDHLDKRARLVLHATQTLNSQRINRAALRSDVGVATAWTDADITDAIDACIDVHLLDGDTELRMHQLFADFLEEVDPRDDLAEFLGVIAASHRSRLVVIARQLTGDPADAELALALTGFALRPADWTQAGVPLTGDDARQVSRALVEIGAFAAARRWFEQAVDEARQGDVHGRVNHVSLGSSLHLVGYCYTSVGEFAQARRWFEQAVDEKRQGDVHGRVDHASLGSSLHQVGYCYANVGEFAQARPWFEQAVDEARQGDVHGRVDHASVGSSVHQVGYCYASVGEFAQARPWLEQAVDEARQGDVHGRVNHVSLGSSLQLGAACLRRLGESSLADDWEAEARSLSDE